MIKDDEYAILDDLDDGIKEKVLKYFQFINDGDIEAIKPFVSNSLYENQVKKYEEMKNQGLKQVYKDIIIFDNNWDVIERDEKGLKTISYMPRISIEMYVINENTNEIVEGLVEFQEEIRYGIVLSRNDSYIEGEEGSLWIIDCVDELERKPH